MKVQPPAAHAGRYSQDAFEIDEAVGTVRCPKGIGTELRSTPDRSRHVAFGDACEASPTSPAMHELEDWPPDQRASEAQHAESGAFATA